MFDIFDLHMTQSTKDVACFFIFFPALCLFDKPSFNGRRIRFLKSGGERKPIEIWNVDPWDLTSQGFLSCSSHKSNLDPEWVISTSTHYLGEVNMTT